jgi:hypothetical protein
MLRLDGVEWLVNICDLRWATNEAFVTKAVVSTADLLAAARNCGVPNTKEGCMYVVNGFIWLRTGSRRLSSTVCGP